LAEFDRGASFTFNDIAAILAISSLFRSIVALNKSGGRANLVISDPAASAARPQRQPIKVGV
jgi:hypothetical protein